MHEKITMLTGEPTIAVIAEQTIRPNGVMEMMEWVKSHRPECLPDDFNLSNLIDRDYGKSSIAPLFPHTMKRANAWNASLGPDLSDNELLVELAGRKCYDSFGLKAGQKTNAEYIANTQSGEVKHASILYHAKMTFFIAGVSRRVSHELIRNYVGADRDEEGAPSQESTRFTHHYGSYIAPPRVLDDQNELEHFEHAMQTNYNGYLGFIDRQFVKLGGDLGGLAKGMARKRIYEAASSYLSHACETSFIWTTNPGALTKLLIERDNEAADAEFQRFAKKWKRICLAHWPNLFPRFVEEAQR